MSRRSSRSVVDVVSRFVRRLHLFPPGARVAVAVSGGSDSVALFRLLLRLEGPLGIEVVGVVHVNHQLRGDESERDERFCRELAAEHGRRAEVERVDLSRRRPDGRRRTSPEDAAREARYAAFERSRTALGADIVALGHTRDDQAETVLLRILRGTGPEGLGGIPPRRGPYVRPLLETGRAELRDWLADVGQGWVDDSTNAERHAARNVVRHEVLPALEARAPHARHVLARLAAIARDDAEWTAGLTAAACERLITVGDRDITISGEAAAEAPAVQRRVVLAALRAAGVRQPGLDQVESLRGLLLEGGRTRHLPGRVVANRKGAAVVLTSGAPPRGEAPPYRYELAVPGRVEVPEAGAVLAAGPGEPGATREGRIEIAVDGEALGSPIVVRNWCPGDWIRPAGLGGRKKLQDVFVDAKLPGPERRRLPLVAGPGGHVLWVPGLAADERLRVTDGTKAVVVLRLTSEQAPQVGGPE